MTAGSHEINVQRKGARALSAIAQLIQLQINQPGLRLITDTASGWAYWRHALVVLNDSNAWAAISAVTGDATYDTSRADIFAGLEVRCSARAADPFAGLTR